MSVYSTKTITRAKALKIIREHIKQASDRELVEMIFSIQNESTGHLYTYEIGDNNSEPEDECCD